MLKAGCWDASGYITVPSVYAHLHVNRWVACEVSVLVSCVVHVISQDTSTYKRTKCKAKRAVIQVDGHRILSNLGAM
eukprot:641186-Pyramimonas_sp.AAC.1